MNRSRPLVPNPCHEDWDKLTPEERGHFCTVCQTKVWDLSSLTKAEAEEFLREAEGDLCVSYEEKGGEVVHREAPPIPLVPLGRLVRRLPAAAGFSLALAACTPSGQDPKPAGNDAQTEPAKPTPEPEPEPDEVKPDEEAPTTAVDEPEPPPEPEEQHVKGKWAAPEDDPNDKIKPDKPVQLGEDEKPDKPVVKKGKVRRPD